MSWPGFAQQYILSQVPMQLGLLSMQIVPAV